MVTRKGWQMVAPGQMTRVEEPIGELAAGEALVRVAGCGVCHTDLGFFYEGVRTRHPLPLTLGHEIAGFVEAGPADLVGKAVLVPAVIPCGECVYCRDGQGGICTRQIFPGNDVHGGFASHVVVPARGLCVVPGCERADQALGASGVTLPELAVIADAVSTPWQAAVHADVKAGDVAVVVGAGGVGGYAAQIALAKGAHTIAIDVNAARLEAAARHGAIPVDAREPDVKKRVRALVKERGWPDARWKIFETSGKAAGQQTAWELLVPGAHLGVVGYTRDASPIRLSNLMAFDATARGTWGCLPRHYPDILALVLDGRIDVRSHTETRSLGELPGVFHAVHHGLVSRRVVLTPESP
ncbi:MAG: 6-hydroxycyclohex-1-ene-1-carbonyl-CoA dehydrogenase [Myxococcota bacterium]